MRNVNVIFTMMVAASVTVAHAGFLDGIKKIGGGVVEAAGSAFDSAVKVTTNTVQSISSSSGASAKPAQQSGVDTKPVTSVNDSPKQDSVQAASEKKPTQYELEQARRKRNEEERERRYQAEQERQRVGREKYKAEQAGREKAEREDRNAREKVARDETDRKRAEQESREKAERERAKQEALAQEQVIADKEAKEKAEMIQAMKDTVAMLKELHDSSELDEFVKWDESGDRFHGSRYVGHTARERAYNKIRTEGLVDISGFDIIAIDHLPADTLADVPEYMMSVDGRGGISIPKTAKSVELYKAAVGKLLNEEREIVRRKKEVVEREAKEKAAIEKAKADAIANAHAVIARAHAKAAGSPVGYEFKPISVFRSVKLGMTIEEVLKELEVDSEALGVNMDYLKEVLYNNRSIGYGDDEYDGADYNKWIGGRACKIPLKSHILVLRFAYVAGEGENKRSVLVFAELKFRNKDNAPEPSAVCEKYAQIPGVKVSKEKEKYDAKFKDGTPQFWKVIYWKICGEIKNQKERYRNGWADPKDPSCKEFMAKLEADEKIVKADIVEDVFREVDVFDVDGMQIRVKPNMATKKALIVTFEDIVMLKWLEEFKAGFVSQKEKAAADAKAAAEKKAKSAALDF